MSSVKTGNAGEHLVMAELLARGHHAAMADRGNPAYDILSLCGGRHSSLRVKTSRSANVKWSTKRDGTVFLELSRGNDSDFVVIVLMPERPRNADFYILPTAVVDRTLKTNHKKWLASPRLDGKPRTDAKRWAKYHDAWHLLEG